jgi:hypothetical protein
VQTRDRSGDGFLRYLTEPSLHSEIRRSQAVLEGEIGRRAVRHARPGAIPIFHDGSDARGGFRGQTVDAVRLVIDELAGRGFGVTTVDTLLAVPAYQGAPRSCV